MVASSVPLRRSRSSIDLLRAVGAALFSTFAAPSLPSWGRVGNALQNVTAAWRAPGRNTICLTCSLRRHPYLGGFVTEHVLPVGVGFLPSFYCQFCKVGTFCWRDPNDIF